MERQTSELARTSFGYVKLGLVAGALVAAAACGSSSGGSFADSNPGGASAASRADGGVPSSSIPSASNGSGSGGATSELPSDSDSGPESGDDAAASGDGPAVANAVDGASACPKEITKPSQLVFLGDSYLNWGEALGWDTIVPRLETHLMTEGSAAYSAMPRRYDVAGANMSQIAGQYTSAHTADPDIDTIVTDGGGNDILLGDRSCLTSPPTDSSTTCEATINSVIGTAKTMFAQMQTDGVKHVLFFFYPHVDTVDANGNAIGISGEYANATLDYAYPLAQGLCASFSFCTFVDTRPAWGDNYAMYIDPQGFGVHPNDMGSELLVDDAIWPAMVKSCLAQ